MNDTNNNAALCGLCGHPMPVGEEMFQYHGYSGPCPEQPARVPSTPPSGEEQTKEQESHMDKQANSSGAATASKVAPDTVAKYIEAPWKVDALGMSVWGRDARDGGDSKIADIRGWGHLTGTGGGLALSEDVAEAVQRARGHILAAAPELLAAARLARHALDGLMGDTDLPDDDSDEMKAMQALSAAIAKAEGRQ